MATTTHKAVARVTVDVYIDAENLNAAEKAISAALALAKAAHRVTASEWVPDFWVPEDDER